MGPYSRCGGGNKPMEFKELSVTIGKGGSDDVARFFLTGGAVLPFPVSNFSKVDVTDLKLTSTNQGGYTVLVANLQVSNDGTTWNTIETINKTSEESSVTESTSIDVSNYDYFRINLAVGNSWYNGKYTPTAKMTIGTIKLS